MSKKNQEQNKISELLSKLKATFPEMDKKGANKKKDDSTDTGDAEFQKQLASMLHLVTDAPAKKKRGTKKPAPAQPLPEEVLVEDASLPKAPEATIEVAAEAEPEVATTVAPPPPAPQKSRAKKKTSAPQPISAETVDEAPPAPPEEVLSEEPVLEEPMVEAPIAEEILPEEPLPAPEQPSVEEEAPTVAPIAPPSAPPKQEISVDVPQKKEAPTAVPTSPNAAPSPKKAAGAEPIVIRPPKSGTARQESIVIRPRVTEKPQPVPQKVTPQEASRPIRIGKEAAPLNKSTPTSPKQEATAPRASAAIPQASKAPKRPNVSVPSSKETPRFARPTKVTPPAVDNEPLDEVIEENLSEEIYVAPVPKKAPPAAKEPLRSTPARPLTPAEEICQKAGLSEEDLDLLFDLGYDSELRTLVGSEHLKLLKSEYLRKLRRGEKNSYPTAFGYRGKEYVDAEDNATVLAAFSRDRKRLILRLVFTALLSILLLFLEPPGALGAYGDPIRAISPLLLPLASILLLLGNAALSYKSLWAGIRALCRLSPTPYSVSGVLLLPALIYDGIALFLPLPFLPVNFLVSLTFLTLLLCDVFRLSTQMRSFRILSSEKEKFLLEETAPRKQKMRQGTKIIKLIHTGDGTPQYRIAKGVQTTGFFRRCHFTEDTARPFMLLIATMLSAALLLGFAGALLLQEATSVVSLCAVALLLCTPLAAVIGYVYPMFRAERILAYYGCTLVGEESVAEYNGPKTLIFEDRDMFLTEKCTEIALREDGDFQNDVKLASALFRKLGSTLDPIGQACSKQSQSIPVTLVRITDVGVEATVGNRHVLAGSAAFLKKGGVKIPKESTDRTSRRNANVSLMHVAIDGSLKLSYEIEYTCKSSFEILARHLAECNTTLAIRSYDPNLNDAFLQSARGTNAIPICVIKPGRYEVDTPLPLCDTGAVSTEDPEQLVGVLLAASGVTKLRRFALRMQLIASLLGFGGLLLLTWLGKADAFGPLQILLYQLFWTLVTLIASHAELTDKKLHLKK